MEFKTRSSPFLTQNPESVLIPPIKFHINLPSNYPCDVSLKIYAKRQNIYINLPEKSLFFTSAMFIIVINFSSCPSTRMNVTIKHQKDSCAHILIQFTSLLLFLSFYKRAKYKNYSAMSDWGFKRVICRPLSISFSPIQLFLLFWFITSFFSSSLFSIFCLDEIKSGDRYVLWWSYAYRK